MSAARDLIARSMRAIGYLEELGKSEWWGSASEIAADLLAAVEGVKQEAERDRTCATCRWLEREQGSLREWITCGCPEVHARLEPPNIVVTPDYGCLFHQPREAA